MVGLVLAIHILVRQDLSLLVGVVLTIHISFTCTRVYSDNSMIGMASDHYHICSPLKHVSH